MSFAYMPFFTGDYLRDTRHLSMAEHGAYFLALTHCWDSKGPMPLDERKQFAIVCARSNDEMEAWRRVRADFFVRMEDGWYQPRMQREVERSENISRARSDAGRRGYEARAKHLPSKSQANAELLHLSPSPSPSLSPTQKTKIADSPVGVRPPAPAFDGKNEGSINARAVVELAVGWELPESWGVDAEALGWKPASVVLEAEKFRQYWVAGKGAGTRRSIKGWRQAWSNWMSKAAEMKR